MKEWTVNIEGELEHVDEAMAERVLEALDAFSPAVSYGNGRIGVTISVDAPTPRAALAIAEDAFAGAVSISTTHVEIDLAA